MSTNSTRIRKSERLSKDEIKALKTLRKDFSTMVDFSEAVGVARQTLDRVFLFGSGSPESIRIIKEYLGKVEKEEAESGAQI